MYKNRMATYKTSKNNLSYLKIPYTIATTFITILCYH